MTLMVRTSMYIIFSLTLFGILMMARYTYTASQNPQSTNSQRSAECSRLFLSERRRNQIRKM